MRYYYRSALKRKDESNWSSYVEMTEDGQSQRVSSPHGQGMHGEGSYYYNLTSSSGGGRRTSLTRRSSLARQHDSTKRAGNSIDFPGRIIKGAGWFIASFPGRYETEWEEITDLYPDVSVACVFFPDSSSDFFGNHEIDTLGETSDDFTCHCHSLYNHMGPPADWYRGRAPWGCQVGDLRSVPRLFHHVTSFSSPYARHTCSYLPQTCSGSSSGGSACRRPSPTGRPRSSCTSTG